MERRAPAGIGGMTFLAVSETGRLGCLIRLTLSGLYAAVREEPD
jgi:hypothetical protein